MRVKTPNDLRRFAAPAAALLALAACSGQEEMSAPEENTVSAEPLTDPAVEQTPATSIIRPEVVPDPVVDLPAEPLDLTIRFTEGAALDEAAERQLADVLKSEALAEGWPVVLRGHSDSAGTDAANLRASRRRAEAVAAWLTERGIAQERISIIPFGEQNPIAPNARPDGSPDEQGRARNRRVELVISAEGQLLEDDEDGASSTGQDTAATQADQGLTRADMP
jgi:OmpA-OmpF porin, OOP family